MPVTLTLYLGAFLGSYLHLSSAQKNCCQASIPFAVFTVKSIHEIETVLSADS